ncbi:related to POL12 (DNA-directed DNA polymerase alpha) [Cephalotrichum gorgonifer]|uniref:DNA polymerase alpha subunit B n=1 Tax=Cephalotrichum gorgonifer TaxID=2041049 RepID=A0AAE8N7T2_9PEZI|nr:related to POL12 (DNA-directed DNA polymerase alpha) [Cephalotrichum gorgonifer]
MADDASLHEYFSPNGLLEPDVLAELQSITRSHNLSAEDLFYKWESYCIRLDTESSAVTLPVVRNFKQGLLDEVKKNNHAKTLDRERKVGATPRGTAVSDRLVVRLDGLVPGTPASGKSSRIGVGSAKKLETPSISRIRGSNVPSSSPDFKTPVRASPRPKDPSTPAPVSFTDRPNAGDVVDVLNDHLTAPETPFAPYPEPRVKLNSLTEIKKLAYKPLAMKLSEASGILDDRITEFMDLIRETRGIDESEFGSAAAQSPDPIVAVGRIASDSAEGKLNPASLLLETSRRIGGGLRVPLNMSRMKGYSVFPGQIAAFRGTNASGNEFIVDKVIDLPLGDDGASPPDDIEAHASRLRGDPDAMDSDSDPAPLTVLFASGPYTPDDNLDYEALHEICRHAASTYADALVLTGPFLDTEHPLIATGDFDLPEDAAYDPDTATMTTVFRHLVSPPLAALAQANPSVTIILVPSVRDVLSKHVSWPQDLFPRKDLGLPRAARIVPNPMNLFINEMILGVSSQDALYELRSEELLVGEVPVRDPAARLSRYLLEQRHYFPLFPPTDRSRLPRTGTDGGVAPGAVLDTGFLQLGEMGAVKPDVLIVPSALQPFARGVESVLAINPGSLSKRRGAGTYARMTLFPRALDADERGADLVSHRVLPRARVEIVKI